MNQQDEVSGATGSGKRYWNEQQARAMVEELALSGETAVAFAERKGISPQRLGRWKKRLATEQVAVGFTEVSLADVPVSAACIEIQVGSIQLRVREDLEPEHLARLVVALDVQSRSC